MTGGADLLGQQVEPRKRGRPKGSGNKRAKDLVDYVAARFGGSAAQQMAALAMVTPAEVRQAGGVLQARVAKAEELKEALGCTLKEAWELISRELAALAPYTDKRQPLAIEAPGVGLAPSVVFQLGAVAGQAMPMDAEFVEVFEAAPAQVSPSKSHEDSQAPDLPGLLPAPASD